MERIDSLIYQAAAQPSTREAEETTLFLTGPGEFLCREICRKLLASPVWPAIFGEFIDPYKRMDYGMRNLPAIRLYTNGYRKDYESWFVNGNVTLDLIFPANIRRVETMQIPASICAALLQEFRRPTFFSELMEVVPGLNELGKTMDVDNSLAFDFGGEDLAPLTQVLVNFKLDLRDWDSYLESDDRTKDEPFTRPLGDLEQIVTTIQALRDDGDVDLEFSNDQPID